jgi:arabinogalactan endo-1,4-beta-galactosidase
MSGKKSIQKALGITIILVMVLSMFASNASAIFGTAVINPIESNIAVKWWVSASASSGSSAALVKDGDLQTGWVAGDQTAGHWVMLDLSGQYDNLRKTEVVFADTNAAYQYKIEASSDGSSWDVVADRTGNTTVAAGFVDLFTRPGTQYVRLTITGATPGATMGVKELRVFNYLRENIVLGADMSNMDQFQTRNYYLHPLEADRGPGPHVLDVVQDQGFDFIRLRIWNQPRNENNGALTNPPRIGPERSAIVATWIKQRDLKLGIDFHYADSWADPGKQPKPMAWAALEFDDLVTAMHDFTYDYVTLLKNQGTTPDKVAVGNEIINGFMWGSETLEMNLSTINPAYVRNNQALYLSQPGGGLLWRYWGSTDPVEQQKYHEAFDRFATLVAAGIHAVREASPETEVEIHVIVDQNRLPKTMEFYAQLLPRINALGADPDVLGISYYPQWHGTFEDLELGLNTISLTYPQYKVNISEHSYPASGGGGTPLPNATEPRTIQGQANMYQRTIQAANDIVNNRGVGMLLWEPQSWDPMFRSVPGMANTFEPFRSIEVFNKSFARNILESSVYVTTVKQAAPALPATVQMLTTADASVAPVPVAWAAVDPALYAETGSFTVTGSTDYGPVTAHVTVIYDFSGFLPPVSPLPALNEVRAGNNVPLRFSLNGDQGLAVVASGYPQTQQIVCATGAPLGAAVPALSPGDNVLMYDPATDEYNFLWRTVRAQAGTCQQVILRLSDSTEYRANFSLR